MFKGRFCWPSVLEHSRYVGVMGFASRQQQGMNHQFLLAALSAAEALSTFNTYFVAYRSTLKF
jgi:hypothetical protein